MADRLANRVALVFGAGSVGPGWGNGKAAAVAFAREGARVVAVDWRGEAAEETREHHPPAKAEQRSRSMPM